MQSSITNRSNNYKSGIYQFKNLRIGPVPFDAEVEVFRPDPISRSKPTAFVAGHGYEKSLGEYPVDKVIYKAEELGALLGVHYTLITGHCQGVPSYVAKTALEKGTSVIGLSPFSNKAEHWEIWRNTKIYTETKFQLKPEESASLAIHTGYEFWHRDVFNVELTNNHRQHVYVLGGHQGTNHELDVSVAHHAVVGALLGVGGISGDMANIKAHYDRHGITNYIVMDTDPKALVEKVIKLDGELKEQNHDADNSTTPLTEFLDTLESRIIVSPSP